MIQNSVQFHIERSNCGSHALISGHNKSRRQLMCASRKNRHIDQLSVVCSEQAFADGASGRARIGRMTRAFCGMGRRVGRGMWGCCPLVLFLAKVSANCVDKREWLVCVCICVPLSLTHSLCLSLSFSLCVGNSKWHALH